MELTNIIFACRQILLLSPPRTYRAFAAMPVAFGDFPQRRINAEGVISDGTGVAGEQVASVAAGLAILHVIVLLLLLVVASVLLAVRATPFSLRGFVQLGVETNEMIRARASVAKDYLTALLTNLFAIGYIGKDNLYTISDKKLQQRRWL